MSQAGVSGMQPVAIIAGGGSGIGRGCALRLARLGYHIIVVGRTESKLAATVEEIIREGGSAAAFAADVRDWERVSALQALVAEQGLDLLINSAGGQFPAPAAELSQNGRRAVIETNLTGSMAGCSSCELTLADIGVTILTSKCGTQESG